MAIMGMSVVAVVGLAAGAALTRRLERISDTVRRFAEGDRTVRAELPGRDELARLAGNFDRMADAVAQQQARLQEQGEYIQLLMDSTSEAIYGGDREGRFTFVNAACVRLLGYDDASELVGRDIHSTIHHHHGDGTPYPARDCRIRLASREGQSAHVDDEVHWRKDGTCFPVEYWSHPMVRDGRQYGTVVTFLDITERRRAQAELRQFKTTLDSTKDCVFVFDPHTLRFVYVNQGATQQVGYDAEELLRMTPVDLKPDYDETAFRALIAPLVSGQQSSISLETRHRHKSGYYLPVEIVLQYLSPKGEAPRFVAVVRDITERRRSQSELQQFKTTLDLTQDIVLIFDPDTLEFTYVNERAAQHLGYSREELLRLKPPDINPDFTEPEMRAILGSMRADGSSPGLLQTRHRHRSGHDIPVEISLQYIAPAGERPRFLALGRDVTERRRAEQALRRMNEELEQRVQERTAKLQQQATILDQIHDSVVSTDLHGVITGWNKGAERLFGYTAEEALGQHVDFIYPTDRLSTLEEQVIAPLKERGEHETEVVMQRKSGERFEAHLSLSLLRDPEGHPVGMVGYSLDITARNEALRESQAAKVEAERANLAKSEFLSRMSHELRTPLNAILGFGQLLELHPDAPAQRDHVREILGAGRHLLTLIDEVLDLARVESGNLTVSPEPVAVLPLVQECQKLLRLQAQARNIRLVDPSPQCAVHLRADRTRLKQVLLNLLSNAVKYNREGGSVSVACLGGDGASPGTLRIRVHDTGAGLRPEQLPRLFVPFDRLDAEAQRIPGTGIGLALSKRLVELMGGQIGVESTPGAGSTFWVELPLAEPHAEAARPPAPAPAAAQVPPAVTRREVLCIEDNPANLRLIESIFERRPDIRLLTAMDPSLGLELARTHRPALVLLDINLPDMDGYAVMQCLRESEATRRIPVVAVSANAMPRDLERAKAAGFAAYLTKPLDVPALMAQVDDLLRRANEGPAIS
jgi:PAS domain S-box-containing protein